MLLDWRNVVPLDRQVLLSDHRGGPPGLVFYVTLEVTYRCNLKCRHCHIGSTGVGLDMDLEPALQLFDQAAALGVDRIYLTGGEPLLHPHYLRLMEEIAARGMELGMISNGQALTPEVARRLKKLDTRVVAVSLSRSDASGYDSFTRTPGSFDAAVRGLASLKEAGIPKIVMLTMGSQTGLPRGEIDRLVDLAGSLGVEIGDERMMPIGRAGRQPQPLITDAKNYRLYCEHLHHKRLEMEGRVPILSADPLWFMVDPRGPFSYRGQDSAPDRKTPFCVAGWHMAVTPDFDVKPCAFFHVRAGSLREHPLDYIWNESPLMRALRCKKNIKGKCGRCEYNELCGGCRSTALSVTGDMFAEDPLCWRD